VQLLDSANADVVAEKQIKPVRVMAINLRRRICISLAYGKSKLYSVEARWQQASSSMGSTQCGRSEPTPWTRLIVRLIIALGPSREGAWTSEIGCEASSLAGEAAFRENEIGSKVLQKITAEGLKELGVAVVGHRRTILAAIEELPVSSDAPGRVPKLSGAASPSAKDAAERRQPTVMFCDLVGSTALSARPDPEDMGDLIRAFQDVVAVAVARFGSHVAKLMGDGALIYFGYPRAHEDDAERAARAGLEVVEAVAALRGQRGVALDVRVGVATGVIVVGELMGDGVARERGVFGETPNLAARLQALVEPGSGVIAASTRRLLGRAFELKPLGPQALKGFNGPIPAWIAIREVENLSRFERTQLAAMTPFVGRGHEVALLVDRWGDAVEGEGQVVSLSGDAGIGKSRILTALRERIGSDPHTATRYGCSPYHVSEAFYPISAKSGMQQGSRAASRQRPASTNWRR
jgi:class 3 adenylate cyclase